jgi:acetyl-CoA carboxylase carboxyl transferase subunit beta
MDVEPGRSAMNGTRTQEFDGPIIGAGHASGAPSWVCCPSCGTLLYAKRLRRNLGVCPECDHHLRLGRSERLQLLTDARSWAPFDLPARPADPLRFVDLHPYLERLTAAARRSGHDEAAAAGTALIGGHRVVLVVLDFDFLGGSMGTEVGRRVAYAADKGLREHLPLIVVCASGGARMQEGALSLMQMARTAELFGRLREAGIPSFCVLTDPTYGGVSASFASLGGILIAERGAHVGFAGPRVVEQTIREPLPAGFQTAEFLLAHGLVDRVEPRSGLRPLLVRLLDLHAGGPSGRRDPEKGPRPLPDAVPPGEPQDGIEEPQDGIEVRRLSPDTSADDPWTVVQAARDTRRPTTRDYLDLVFDDVVELHGDRVSGDDPAIVTALARLGTRTVVVIGHQKGHSVKELVAARFGMPLPEGYRKATRMLDYAEGHGLPVVTLVDTPGAHPGVDAETRGQSLAIAEMLLRMGRLRVPVVAAVTGEGGSGGALALCAGDRLLMMEHSYLSVISPEGCAAILWRDAQSAPTAAGVLRLLPRQLCALGVASHVVPEPPGGAQADPRRAACALRAALMEEVDELADVPGEDLCRTRAARLAAFDGARVVRS